MSDLIVVTDTTLLGGFLALVVFGGLRFIDDVVDVLASLDGGPAPEPPDDADRSGS